MTQRSRRNEADRRRLRRTVVLLALTATAIYLGFIIRAVTS